MPPPNALRLVVWITLSAILLGGLFAIAEYQPVGLVDLVNACLHGALVGGLTAGILSSLEIFVLRRAQGASLRQLPFLPYLALRSLLYVGVILMVESLEKLLIELGDDTDDYSVRLYQCEKGAPDAYIAPISRSHGTTMAWTA